MITSNFLPNMQPVSLGKSALQGATIAFLLVGGFLSFLLLAGHDMKFGAWVLPPLSIGGLGGAIGGTAYSLMHRLIPLEGWKKALANALFALLFIAGLWLCMVLGLAMVGLWD